MSEKVILTGSSLVLSAFIKVKRLIVARKNIKTMSNLETFEKLLQNHDWFYQYSEDFSVYERGLFSQDTINTAIKVLEDAGFGDEANSLYEKYLPKQLKY